MVWMVIWFAVTGSILFQKTFGVADVVFCLVFLFAFFKMNNTGAT